jgi:hypothetical protein
VVWRHELHYHTLYTGVERETSLSYAIHRCGEINMSYAVKRCGEINIIINATQRCGEINIIIIRYTEVWGDKLHYHTLHRGVET